MIPTAEEKTNILEAQMANPDIPLGTAEQFLLTLSSISELQARLSLWLFKLDYETIESVCSSIRIIFVFIQKILVYSAAVTIVQKEPLCTEWKDCQFTIILEINIVKRRFM